MNSTVQYRISGRIIWPFLYLVHPVGYRIWLPDIRQIPNTEKLTCNFQIILQKLISFLFLKTERFLVFWYQENAMYEAEVNGAMLFCF
jgi:hypothetical protein